MKYFKVEKITSKEILDYGRLPESAVKALLKGYRYDKEMELWFSINGRVAYDVTPCE